MTRGAAVLVDGVVAQIGELLAAGAGEAEVAKLELSSILCKKPSGPGGYACPLKKRARWIAFSREHQKRAR